MGVFDDKFSNFSSKPYVVTPIVNCLIEMVQLGGGGGGGGGGHSMFYAELTKVFLHTG